MRDDATSNATLHLRNAVQTSGTWVSKSRRTSSRPAARSVAYISIVPYNGNKGVGMTLLRWICVASGVFVLEACESRPPPCTTLQYYHPGLRSCVGICGTREAPAHPECYDSDAGAFVTVDVVTVSDSARPQDGSADAERDVVAFDAADEDGGSANPALLPPRPIAPLSTSIVTSQRPSLRWLRLDGDGAIVELSRSRQFTRVEYALRSSSDRMRPTTPLTAGVWFWRLRSSDSARGMEGASTSPTWSFRVGNRSADDDRDTSWGTDLDLNGDGVSDLAIGAPRAEGQRGRVDVYYGSSTGFPATPSVVLRGQAMGDSFGSAVASAGDTNGDGFSDLIVGANAATPGQVTVFYGSAIGISTTPNLTVLGENAGEAFGATFASIGDGNGDGFADVVIGAPNAGRGSPALSGAAVVYVGTADGLSRSPSFTVRGSAFQDFLGSAVAGAGDINGDGFADLAIGARGFSTGGNSAAGQVRIFLGRAAGFADPPHLVIDGAAALLQLGSAIAGAGDTNGDGYSDLAIGIPYASPGGRSSAGQVIVYRGSGSGFTGSAPERLDGPLGGANFGAALAGVGDSDGDGFAELAVGLPRSEHMGISDVGAVAVYYGTPTTFSARSSAWLQGSGQEEFGTTIVGGDTDGDGWADVIVGANRGDNIRLRAGRAAVFRGGRGALSTASVRTFLGSDTDALATALAL
jgi:hypothetical protein